MAKHHTKEQAIAKLKIKRKMISEGYSNRKISMALGVAVPTLYFWENKYGKEVK